MTETLYHFECPACGFDDDELGRPLPRGEHWCPQCADDRRYVHLRLTRIVEPQRQEQDAGP